ncbi:MAG: hypothetical protein P8N75_14010 [Ascidiaceihabitans sp.]|nr:hypothetical protein [Ascidiaceihabitans sp.]
MPLPEAGIDVVLSQPLDGALLLARVRSLVRSNSSDKDWELGEGTSHALGFAEAQKVFAPSGRTVLVGPNRALLEDWTTQIAGNSPTKTKVAGVDEAINILGTSKNANLPDVFALAMGNHEPEKNPVFSRNIEIKYQHTPLRRVGCPDPYKPRVGCPRTGYRRK